MSFWRFKSYQIWRLGLTMPCFCVLYCMRFMFCLLVPVGCVSVSVCGGLGACSYGITPYWTVCYAAPLLLANISSDPDNPAAQQWWENKVAEIHSLFPTFGGLLVTQPTATHDIDI